jgi:GNAT superfamily N-acetyltransferase
VKIVALKPGDEDRLKSIRLRALREAPDAFGSTYLEVAARPPESWTSQLNSLVTHIAVIDDQDVGVVRGSPDEVSASRVWLISMWVAPEARGRGVGEALVRSIVDWAKRAAAIELVLEVGVHNDPARALYKRMGFEETGVVRRVEPPRDHIVEREMVFRLASI